MNSQISTISGTAIPLTGNDIDTDRIIPARFLRCVTFDGLGASVFEDDRIQLKGKHPFDLPQFQGANILVVNSNFGCGSSREHAPWALHDLGIRCIIATGFGEIFRANMLRNGMLPITLPEADWCRTLAAAELAEPVTVDLLSSVIILADGSNIGFEIADNERRALLNGWDEIDGIRARYSQAIIEFEHRQRATSPWLWQKEPNHG